MLGMDPLGLSVLSMYSTSELHPSALGLQTPKHLSSTKVLVVHRSGGASEVLASVGIA